MENNTINTIEINGKAIDLSKKMIEIPRRKKLFERKNSYLSYLEEILKEAFPFDEKIHTKDDYAYFIDYNSLRLWDAADENKVSLKKEKSKDDTKNKKREKKNSKEESKDKEKKEKKSILSTLAKPFVIVGTVLLKPVKFVWNGLKKLGNGIVNIAKKTNSKMPWANKAPEIDNDKLLEEAEENLAQEIDNDKIFEEAVNEIAKETDKVKEAEEELKKNANEELQKDMAEKLNRQIEELRKENQILKNRIEIAKKQTERDKIWKEYLQEEQEKENTRNKIKLANNGIDSPLGIKYESNKDGKIVWARPKFELTKISEENIKKACEQPYNITRQRNSVKVYKNGIKEYQDSQKLSENEDTITITGELYQSLLYSEYELNVYMRDMAVKAYKAPHYQIDYNYDGLISRNKEKIGGKVVDASVVLNKERYKELVENAAKYFSLMGEVSNYCPDELENTEQKILVK